MKLHVSRKSRIFLRVGAIVVCVLASKASVHYLGWEALTINPLFTGIVAGNVFLMSFLLSGVLSDYKESERLPGELATSLENLGQETYAVRILKPEAQVGDSLLKLQSLLRLLIRWFRREAKTKQLFENLNDLSESVALLERWSQATTVARLKLEVANIRRIIVRVHTIRETSFISSGYLIADLVTILLCSGLVFARIEPFYESLFFVGVISFLLVYLLLMIRDLDNPFGYSERFSGEDVSLYPLVSLETRLERLSVLARNDETKIGEEVPT